MIDAASAAQADGCGLAILHQHAMAGTPRLSPVDLESFDELEASLRQLFPRMAFGSVVLSQDWNAWGLIRLATGKLQNVEGARWLDWRIDRRPEPPALSRPRAASHDALWGDRGDGILRASRIGIVGLSGGGSHIVQQLAHLDIDLVGVEFDSLTLPNRSRVVGTNRRDVGRKKIVAMKRLVRQAGERARIVTIDERFPGPRSCAALAQCDIIIGCVDTLHARKEILAFALQHAIPYVDIGLNIDPTKPEPGVRAIGGQVFIGIPGRSCMWCEGILTQARLDLERDENGYPWTRRCDQ